MIMRRILVLSLMPAALLLAQTDRGNITGSVTDPSGAIIGGATVTVTHRATGAPKTVTTTSAGEYNIPGLAPGEYRVEVSSQGFKRFVQDNVVLAAASTVRLDALLQVGQVTETVEVTTAVAQIQPDNAKI